MSWNKHKMEENLYQQHFKSIYKCIVNPRLNRVRVIDVAKLAINNIHNSGYNEILCITRLDHM